MGRRERRQKLPPGVSFDRLTDVPGYATVDRRPLDEALADESVKTGVVIELAPNNHSDSRAHFRDLKINRSAMQALARRTEAVYDGLAWLNWNYFGTTPPDSITARQADEMAMIGMWLPSYLVLRARRPVDSRRLPNTAGDLYKVGQGIHDAASALRREHGDDFPVTERILYNRANILQGDNDSLFLSEDGKRVCPATERNIRQTTGVLLTTTEGDHARSELNRFLQRREFPNLKNFSIVSTEYIEDYLVFVAEQEKLSRELTRVSPGNEVIAANLEALQRNQQTRERVALRRFNQALGRDPQRIAA